MLVVRRGVDASAGIAIFARVAGWTYGEETQSKRNGHRTRLRFVSGPQPTGAQVGTAPRGLVPDRPLTDRVFLKMGMARGAPGTGLMPSEAAGLPNSRSIAIASRWAVARLPWPPRRPATSSGGAMGALGIVVAHAEGRRSLRSPRASLVVRAGPPPHRRRPPPEHLRSIGSGLRREGPGWATQRRRMLPVAVNVTVRPAAPVTLVVSRRTAASGRRRR